jgi:cytochrome oxidase assembly protein ShyY1
MNRSIFLLISLAFALLAVNFALSTWQDWEIRKLKHAQAIHAQQIEELKTVAKMLNDTTTMQENRYYTLRALINGEK